MKHLLLTTIAAVVMVGCSTLLSKEDFFLNAIRKGNLDGVNQCLDSGMNVNLMKHVESGLLFSIAAGAITAGATTGSFGAHGGTIITPLYEATRSGQKEIVSLLIAKGAYINLKYHDGYTVLHLAAKLGYTEIVKQLIDRGAQVQAKTNKGWTPLHHAVRWGRKGTVSLLIDEGANVNAQNNTGITPMGMAIMQNHLEIVSLLRENGAKTKRELEAAST